VADDLKSIIEDFHQVVNMTPQQLSSWLETENSQQVGQKQEDGAESIGHKSGRQIVQLLERDESDYSEAEIAHMRKVVSYVRRHSAQRPQGDVQDTRWRFSLMNWGHDPLQD
jgi:DNA topoisomerase VI subunit B